jgi:8-oxo-dGTP pyrophosphatase MutT (NUDIX family)
MNIIENRMVVDQTTQSAIITRVLAWSEGAHPAAPNHRLGDITLPDGRTVRLHVRHAVDAIIVDSFDQVALIRRRNPPSVGLLATPGGMLDPIDGRVETDVEGALREAGEETNISTAVLMEAQIDAIGTRNYARPFDIREAWHDIQGTDIKKGDLFAVSTRAVRIKVAGNLQHIYLKAGDDAILKDEQGADVNVPYKMVYRIADLTPDQFGASDHLPMILAARDAAVRIP